MKANTPLKLIDGKLFESPTNYNFVEKKKLLTTITGSPIEIARTSQCTIENFTQLQDVVLISTDKEESSAKKTFNYFTKEWLFDDDKVTEQFFFTNTHKYEMLPQYKLDNDKLGQFFALKPYFDVDYDVSKMNDPLTIEQMMHRKDIFIQIVMDTFNEWFFLVDEVKLILDDFMVLESCDVEKKMSFHIRIQNKLCFKNNDEMKKVVKIFNEDVLIKNEMYGNLFLRDTDKVCIVDYAVYDVDRNIRMVNQSKIGSYRTLNLLTKQFHIKDTLIRLYKGFEGRKMVNIKPFEERYEEIGGTRKTKEVIIRDENGVVTIKKEKIADYTFRLKGNTLQKFFNLEDKQLTSFPNWKRFLYKIPNGERANPIEFPEQPLEIYRNIGWAIYASCDDKKEGLQEYIKWCSLSPDYNKTNSTDTHAKNIFNDTKKFKDEYSNEYYKFDDIYLKKLAYTTDPFYFNCSFEVLNTYFSLNKKTFRCIQEKSQFVSQEGTEDENNIFCIEKFIVIDAYMGKGKTTAIKRIIEQYDSVLFLSSRQTFASWIASEFNLNDYQQSVQGKKLVISIESIWKAPKESYEFVCIDECESILKQFSSTTCNTRRIKIQDIEVEITLVNLFHKFVDFIKKAKKVIFADAFLTNRTMDFIRNTFCNDKKVYISNQIQIKKPRRAKELSLEVFHNKLINSCINGEKNFACWCSAKQLAESLRYLEQKKLDFLHNMTNNNTDENKEAYKKIIEFRKKLLDYSADSGKERKETIKDMAKHWKEASGVFTTPTITIGCSYSIENDFDTVWIQGFPSCVPPDIFQSHMRVRHLKDNEKEDMFYCFPLTNDLNFIKVSTPFYLKTFYHYQLAMKEKKGFIMSSLKKIKDEYEKKEEKVYSKDDFDVMMKHLEELLKEGDNIPRPLQEILYFNLLEQTISRRDYKQMFQCFLVKCNYEFNEYKPNEENLESLAAANFNEYSYEKIAEISYDTQQLYKQIGDGNLETRQKWELKRFWFDKKINLLLDIEIRKQIFDVVLIQKTDTKAFDNGYIEIKKNILQQFETDVENSGGLTETNSSQAQKYQEIQELNEKLGLQNSLDTTISIPTEKLRGLTDFLKEKKKIYSFLFQSIFKENEIDDPSTKLKTILTVINGIYGKWTGGKLKKEDEQKIKYKMKSNWNVSMETLYRQPDINVLLNGSAFVSTFNKPDTFVTDTDDENEKEEIAINAYNSTFSYTKNQFVEDPVIKNLSKTFNKTSIDYYSNGKEEQKESRCKACRVLKQFCKCSDIRAYLVNGIEVAVKNPICDRCFERNCICLNNI